MPDLISRQAAIDAAWFLHADDRDALRDTLRKLPSVSPVKHGKWIPCSERLPSKNEYGDVLVTFIPSGGTLWTKVIIARYSDLMGIAKPGFHIGSVGKNDFVNITNQVTAWMPLPEPYRKADMRGE